MQQSHGLLAIAKLLVETYNGMLYLHVYALKVDYIARTYVFWVAGGDMVGHVRIENSVAVDNECDHVYIRTELDANQRLIEKNQQKTEDHEAVWIFGRGLQIPADLNSKSSHE